MDPPPFRRDLYRGTAPYYDAYRVGYPEALFSDLFARVGSIRRALDVACGTGQVTFPLARRCAEVWAVDQEAETVEFARRKADAAGVRNVRWLAGRAEDLEVEGLFDLVTIGTAFHRLDRPRVAHRLRTVIGRGGHLALLWSLTPQDGTAPWQHELARIMVEWMDAAGAADRIPPGLDALLRAEPHSVVLTEAGYESLGTFDFPVPHRWDIDELIGWMYSTSILSRAALGEHVDRFEHDVRARLSGYPCEEVIEFGYELYRR